MGTCWHGAGSLGIGCHVTNVGTGARLAQRVGHSLEASLTSDPLLLPAWVRPHLGELTGGVVCGSVLGLWDCGIRKTKLSNLRHFSRSIQGKNITEETSLKSSC